MPQNNLIARLAQLKEKMERAKEDKAKAEGRLDSLMERLSKECSCKTVAEAETKLAELEATEDKLTKQVEADLTELESILK